MARTETSRGRPVAPNGKRQPGPFLDALRDSTQAIRIADRGYVIVHGKIAFEGRSADELNNNDLVRKLYMGI